MKVLISGAVGFIGSHAAARFLRDGQTVVGFDNLSRPGSSENLAWLTRQGGRFSFHRLDVRRASEVDDLFAAHRDADVVLHLAGQVAVTSSVADPRHDFEANALGSLNILEAVRAFCPGAALLYASTNKVYGGLENVEVAERTRRYEYLHERDGIGEHFPLDLHSPYGCSKGSADQYVRDYHRIFGLRSVVFRQSCIYGTRQFGVEDQGWIAWFTIATLLGLPMTIYGDGRQTRDVLWVDDLVEAYIRAIERIDRAAGQIYNIGGGPQNTLSLLELLELLRSATGQSIEPAYSAWRPGDQRVFVAGIDKISRELDWRPTVGPEDGVRRLVEWASSERAMLARVLQSFRNAAPSVVTNTAAV